MRSHSVSSSGSSLEVTMMPSPSRQSCVHQPIQLGLGADVDAARRIVEQQHLRLRQQPAADDRLLLIAAAEAGDRRVDARRS